MRALMVWVDEGLASEGPILRARGRVQHLVALLQIAIGLPYVLLFLALGQVWTLVLLVALALAPVALFGFTRRGRVGTGGTLLSVAAFSFILLCLVARGGMSSNAAAWLLVAPVLATFMVGPRHGIVMSLSTTASFVGLWTLEQVGVALPAGLPAVLLPFMPVFDYPALGLVLGSVVWAQAGVWEGAEREARTAAQARYTFLATMSHEIRTPLNGVLGLAEVLLDTSLDAEQQHIVRTIRSSGGLLRTLLDDVLDYSKTDSGHVEVERVPVDLRALCEEVVALRRQPSRERGIELAVELDPQLPEQVISDPTKLRQILGNLTSNALKFTEEGEVRIRACAAEDRLRISVIDTGVGMDEEALGRIFDAFQQADGTTTRKYGGTGLGLAISRSLAECMGGGLTVSSKPGQGSTFRLDLPLERAETSPLPARPVEIPAGGLAGLRVLVAEDNPVNRMVIQRLLEREGVRVQLAENGEACVRAWEVEPPDLILMDCQMPICDGYEATRRIRDAGGSLPIVALTANSMPGDRARCLAAGMDDHMGKPIDVDALRRILHLGHPGSSTSLAG